MPRFFLSARYCTRNGNARTWSDMLEAENMSAAVSLAQTAVEKRHRGASKIDVTVSPETRLRIPTP
ncbi:hypothetical protein AWL63_18145 [Sphingomonas panacis]|uniref:Uncharacterized protein n=1 Tax=Sphingomonas panacis TaxID=1560345 RepID=A0A1B3ZDR9_9SPHN|nr:hypothetical protein AWL63_18145 [Sphingomonas panacis]